jgi:sugar/nucleoside kinase (ribokinase family)
VYSWFWSFFQSRMAGEPTHDIVRDASARGYTVMLDVNYKPKEHPPDQELDELKKALPYVEVLLPNLRDAEILVGRLSPVDTVKALRDLGANVVALKMGEEGCYLGSAKGIVHVPTPEVSVLDTTGAGDVFGGGLAYGWLQGWDWEHIGAFANAASAYSISHEKTHKYPTLTELEEFIDQCS